MNRAVSLLSGGLDSTVATALAIRRYKIALALTFDYGQRAARREIDVAKAFCVGKGIKHQTIELPWLGKITKTALVNKDELIPKASPESLDQDAALRARAVWVPNRNGVFISIAAAFAESHGIETIITGFNAEEAATFPDNSLEFIERANRALKFSTRNGVRVISPTGKMTKKEIAAEMVNLNISADSIWYCYEGGEKPCGLCESCARFIRATGGLR